MTRASATRWLAVAALAALAAMLVVVLLRPAASTPEAMARAIAAELRCPDCAGLSVADSHTAAAQEIRRQIADQLAAGATPNEIKAVFVARYGDWILLTPPGPLVWIVPILAVALGAGVLWWWLRGGRQVPAAAVVGSSGDGDDSRTATPVSGARRAAAIGGAFLLVAVAVGFVLPPPVGLANPTVVNTELAASLAAESARQADIERLLGVLSADPLDAATLSKLADAYLAGSRAEDLRRGALILIALIQVEPHNVDAHRQLVTAYIRAGDWTDAQAVTDALAALDPDSADIPFFRGLISWRGRGDAAAAIGYFDAFLSMAPDDPRGAMIRALRAEAESQPGS